MAAAEGVIPKKKVTPEAVITAVGASIALFLIIFIVILVLYYYIIQPFPYLSLIAFVLLLVCVKLIPETS